tara:strand:- start:912 stop:1220 length:309 start_codon:yes stop_codon:yes gene_type:complete
MKKISYALIIVISILSVNIALLNTLEEKSSALIKEAKSTNKIAIKLKNEWRDVRKLIKKASKAHTNKDYEKSINFAEQALNQAKMSIEQHNKQKDNYRFLDD